jgi:hypothetical protein
LMFPAKNFAKSIFKRKTFMVNGITL